MLSAALLQLFNEVDFGRCEVRSNFMFRKIYIILFCLYILAVVQLGW